MTASLLNGVRVLDLTTGATGAYCGRLLAGMGADVLMFETEDGHPLRWMPPFKGDVVDADCSLIFAYLAAGKKSLSGHRRIMKEHVESLANESDVVMVEDAGPSALATLNLEADKLRSMNPGLVIATLSDMGPGDEMGHWKATKLGLWAASGWLYQTGYPDERPLLPGNFMLTAAMVGAVQAIGVLSAVLSSRETGSGAGLTLPALEIMVGLSYPFETLFAAHKQKMKRVGVGLASTFRVARCKDGYVTICTASDAQREMLSYMVGRADMADQFVKCTGARAWDDEVARAMDEWLAGRTREEVLAEGQSFRVPTGIVTRADEIAQLEQHRRRGFLVENEHPKLGTFLAPGGPVRFSRSGWSSRPAPVKGTSSGFKRREGPRSPSAPVRRLPLEGIRVLELSSYFAGPLAGMYLADLGAEVIKIESIQRTDNWRATWTNPEVEEHWETSPFFNGTNRNKLGLTLNLVDPEGAELFKHLAGHSDVVLTNYSARVMDQFGLNYETLREVNPKIVMVSISGFGLDGPWRDYVSFAPVAESFAGLLEVVGEAGREPSLMLQTPGDSLPAVHAAAAAIAAVLERHQSGEGQHIDVSQLECNAAAAADILLDWEINRRVSSRHGNRHPRYAPHDVFPALGEDAWIAICTRDDVEWQALCAAIGDDELHADKQFASVELRQENGDALYSRIAQWTSRYDKHTLAQQLQKAGVPAAPVNDPEDLATSPELRARDVIRELDREYVGTLPYHTCGIRLEGSQLPFRRPAPRLGGDNDYVLREILGLGEDDLASLEASGVIGSQVAAAATRWTF